jgi:hypothetical protein
VATLIGLWLVFAVGLPTAPAMAQQPIPGSEGWLQTPTSQTQTHAPQKISRLDVALTRCFREAIATGQFFLGDVTYVLGRCRQQFDAWVAECERREGRGAAICLLGPEQAAGELLRDASAHRTDLQGWLRSLPPLPEDAPEH